MRENLKKIFYVRRSWWDSFTSCFIGTLLGVFLTFGISDYLERKEQKENERRILMISMNKLDNSLNSYKEMSDTLNNEKEIYLKIFQGYREKKANFTQEEYDYFFIRLFTDAYWLTSNNLSENIFNNNIDIWKTVPPTSIEYLSMMLDYSKRVSQIFNNILNFKTELSNNYAKIRFGKRDKSEDYYLDIFFNDGANILLMNRLIYEIGYLEQTVTYCQEYMKFLLKELNLTEKEILDFYYKNENHNDNAKNDSVENDTIGNVSIIMNDSINDDCIKEDSI